MFDTTVKRLKLLVSEAMPEEKRQLAHERFYMVKALSDNLSLVWTEKGVYLGEYATDRFG